MRFDRRVEERPLESDAQETQQRTPAETALDYSTLEHDLLGARDAEGDEEVGHALSQVETGEARPEDLLAWIDEIRNSQAETDPDAETEPPIGFMHDFEFDSEMGDSNLVDPDAVGDAAQAAAPVEPSFDSSADADYVFSAVRRRNLGDGDDGDDENGDGDGGTPNADAKPAAKKSKSTKKA